MTKARVQAIEAKYNKSASRLHDVIKAKGGNVPKRYFDTETKEKIGLSQEQGRKLIHEMLEAGSLVESVEGENRKKMLALGRVN